MGNSGVYGKRRFESLDYDECIDTDDIEDDAVDSDKLAADSVDSTALADKLRTHEIVIQLGAGDGTHMITKPANAINIENLVVLGSVNGATTTTTAGLTCTLKTANASGATTATVTGGAVGLSTTAGSGIEAFATTVDASVAATEKLYLVCGATTLVDDNAAAIIQYTID